MFDEIDDVVFLAAHVGGAYNTHGFIEGDVDVLFAGGLDGLTIDTHVIAFLHLRSHLRHLAVDGHAALFNEDVGCTSRAKADFREVFIDARFHGREGI